jgi:hypothetical protein
MIAQFALLLSPAIAAFLIGTMSSWPWLATAGVWSSVIVTLSIPMTIAASLNSSAPMRQVMYRGIGMMLRLGGLVVAVICCSSRPDARMVMVSIAACLFVNVVLGSLRLRHGSGAVESPNGRPTHG